MNLPAVTFVGPPVDDPELLLRLPPELGAYLREANGFVSFDGGFHLRGACQEPDWHSLRSAWLGDESFSRLYPVVESGDVPFAEEALGDQFLHRDGVVWRLSAETGEITPTDLSFTQFIDAVVANPVATLGLEPLLRFCKEGGHLAPGQLLSAYPPFCTKESGAGVSLRAVDTLARRRLLAHLAKELATLPDGAKIQVKVTE